VGTREEERERGVGERSEWRKREEPSGAGGGGEGNDVQIRPTDVSRMARYRCCYVHRCCYALMYLERPHAVGGLELLVRGVCVHAQHRVVIHLDHTGVDAWWGLQTRATSQM